MKDILPYIVFALAGLSVSFVLLLLHQHSKLPSHWKWSIVIGLVALLPLGFHLASVDWGSLAWQIRVH